MIKKILISFSDERRERIQRRIEYEYYENIRVKKFIREDDEFEYWEGKISESIIFIFNI